MCIEGVRSWRDPLDRDEAVRGAGRSHRDSNPHDRGDYAGRRKRFERGYVDDDDEEDGENISRRSQNTRQFSSSSKCRRVLCRVRCICSHTHTPLLVQLMSTLWRSGNANSDWANVLHIAAYRQTRWSNHNFSIYLHL